MIELRKLAILITGASSGIDRQCAITCTQLGVSVGLIGRILRGWPKPWTS